MDEESKQQGSSKRGRFCGIVNMLWKQLWHLYYQIVDEFSFFCDGHFNRWLIKIVLCYTMQSGQFIEWIASFWN